MAKITDTSSESLLAFIQNNVEPALVIITDGWPSYNELINKGYKHKVQKATVKGDDEEILPNVHRIASLLKRWLLGTHKSYLNKTNLNTILTNMFLGIIDEHQKVEDYCSLDLLSRG